MSPGPCSKVLVTDAELAAAVAAESNPLTIGLVILLTEALRVLGVG
jgi:hypothetical protein